MFEMFVDDVMFEMFVDVMSHKYFFEFFAAGDAISEFEKMYE